MSAKEDLAALHSALDQLGQKCQDDPEYRDQLASIGVNDLGDIGASTVMLAEVLAAQGADEDEVSGFDMSMKMFDMETDSIVIRNKKTKVNCITGSGSKGKSCGGRTRILTGGGDGTKHIAEI